MQHLKNIAPPFWHPVQAQAFILDWDGVLANTQLDFKPLRAKYFGGEIVPLIEAADSLSPELSKEVKAAIRKIEMEGAEQATPMPGAHSLIQWLNSKGKPWAVVSRNCLESILLAAEKCDVELPPVLLSREDPHVKPNPEALALAARKLGVPLERCLMVGDFIYDILGARRAGIRAVLVENTEAYWKNLADVAYPTVTEFVNSLLMPEPFVPWEYHDLVQNFGQDYLAGVSKNIYHLPAQQCFRIATELAALGIQRIIINPGLKINLEDWKSFLLPPQAIDMPLLPLLQNLLNSRWPQLTIEEHDLSKNALSIEVPVLLGPDLQRFIMNSIQCF